MWFFVLSYTEKADFQQNHLPSGFPYFKSIQQYWSSYCCVHGLTHGKYPFDFGEHEMLVVIGSSFSVEYLIRAAYENTMGRFTEWLSSGEEVEEDVYSNRVAREYADFVHIRPFYELLVLEAISKASGLKTISAAGTCRANSSAGCSSRSTIPSNPSIAG